MYEIKSVYRGHNANIEHTDGIPWSYYRAIGGVQAVYSDKLRPMVGVVFRGVSSVWLSWAGGLDPKR